MQQARRALVGRREPRRRGRLGHLAAVAQAGQRVGDRLLAQRVVAEDVGRRRAALGHELGQQRDLVVLERARAAREAPRAPCRPSGAGDAERQRERPAGGVAASCSAGRWRSPRRPRRRSARPQVRRARPRAGAAARAADELRQPASASSASIEPRSMMSTQRVEVELGGEGVAHAAHGRLQAAALADRRAAGGCWACSMRGGGRGPAA